MFFMCILCVLHVFLLYNLCFLLFLMIFFLQCFYFMDATYKTFSLTDVRTQVFCFFLFQPVCCMLCVATFSNDLILYTRF